MSWFLCFHPQWVLQKQLLRSPLLRTQGSGSLFQACCRSEHGLGFLTCCWEFYCSDFYHPSSFNLFCCQIRSPSLNSVGSSWHGSFCFCFCFLWACRIKWSSFSLSNVIDAASHVESQWNIIGSKTCLGFINGSLTSACDLMNCVLSLYFNFKRGFSSEILTIQFSSLSSVDVCSCRYRQKPLSPVYLCGKRWTRRRLERRELSRCVRCMTSKPPCRPRRRSTMTVWVAKLHSVSFLTLVIKTKHLPLLLSFLTLGDKNQAPPPPPPFLSYSGW